MKKAIAILLIAVMVLTVVACSARSKLVGTWIKGHESLTFKKDGTGYFKENGRRYPLTYETDGDTIFISMDDEDVEGTFEIKGDKLILRADGEKLTFRKK